MRLATIISEVEFFTYSGLIKVLYKDMNSSEVAEIIRALPGVTVVTLVRGEENAEVLKVKLLSQKTGSEAFKALKNNAIKKYPDVTNIEIGDNTIEKLK